MGGVRSPPSVAPQGPIRSRPPSRSDPIWAMTLRTVAGLQLDPDQWQEAHALCAALRAGHEAVASFAHCMNAVVAAVALSGAARVLVYGPDACRAEFSALKSALAVFQMGDPDAALCTPIFGPTVVLLDASASFTRPAEPCDLVLVLLTMRELRAQQSARLTAKKFFQLGVPVLLHAPLFVSQEDAQGLLGTIASYICKPMVWGSPPAAAIPAEGGMGGVVAPQFERRPHAPFSDAVLASLRRALGGGAPEILLAASRLRSSVRRDSDVVAFVKNEALRDRDIVVVCETKSSLETTKRLLARAHGLAGVQTVLIDALYSRNVSCLSQARGARSPMVIFADPPAYELEICSAHAHACALLGRRTAECVVFLWMSGTHADRAEIMKPAARWNATPCVAAAEALVRAFVV
jgi:hypothetical protein